MKNYKRFYDTESGSAGLRLPKPDPANITVLTPNLPNKPILPWTHFDSPWLENEENHPEEGEEEVLESTDDTQESINSDDQQTDDK
ncbi:hypothetical protein [Brasilonema sp. UFV-L1]|uniref:hypothetical protein n=1 Tax=Brasilonema sp. UFV-L1 TaxID=2234130 RepID=UPI00145E1D63|nr:hypothetical protein [Brasilonema sp. UFV-L1]NMG05692.1 hypothetical protein [Brasilonema sp. UFV-L1]